MRLHWYLLVIFVLMTGCAPAPAQSSTEGLPPPAETQSVPTEAASGSDPIITGVPIFVPTQGDKPQMDPIAPLPPVSGIDAMIESARQDLAKRLSVQASEIGVVEGRDVVWGDGSLGCPQPDMMYAQVLTSGYLVKLNYGGRDFEYHSGMDGSLFFCKNPQPPVEGAPSNT